MIDLKTVDYFTDESIIEDPVPYYELVREQGPVWREPHHGAFVVTGYDEIADIYRHPETFSSCNAFAGPFAELPEGPHGDDVSTLIEKCRDHFPNSESFITWDPPRHSAHRGLLMRLLTRTRLQENEAFMLRLADRQIDGFIANGTCEFVAEYAQPLAMLVIADLLGVPENDHGALHEAFVSHGTAGAVGRPSKESNFLGFLEAWFTGYIEDRRRDPREDELTRMALAEFADGSTPTVVDVVRVATLLFAGGHGTAARFLTNMMKLLAEHPELQEQLRREGERIPQFIEEMLRYNSPVKVNFRMAQVSANLAGVDIPAGSTLMILLGAVDRDPRRFTCPAEFDIDRANAREHAAFGQGVHFCPGAPLVRTEGRITVERMLDRVADIRISDTAHGPDGARQYDYTPSYILRGVEALHLDFTPAA